MHKRIIQYLTFHTIIFFLVSNSVIFSQWEFQNPLPQGNRLYSVQFINNNTGWACGNHGSFIKTTDGGSNWAYLPLDKNIGLQFLYFLNENTGYIAQQNSVLLKTTNGGLNFIKIKDSIAGNYNKICFTDNLNGWISGYFGTIIHTSDGGNNWNFQQTNTTDEVVGIAFPNSNTGYANTWETGKILKTTNGGNNWNIINTDGNHYTAMYFDNANTGWSAGIGILNKTTNGGNTWVNKTPPGLYGYVYDIKFINENTGWFSSGTSTTTNGITKTTDGGNNWFFANVPIQTDEWIISICLTDSLHLWGVGDYGFIVNSTNAGENWIMQSKITTFAIPSIKFLNANTAFATANWFSGKLLFTTNAGNNWTIKNEYDFQLGKINFLNQNTGIIPCYKGIILRTTNAGNNWQQIQALNNKIDYFRSFFLNENTGWVTTDTGMIIKTTNGGLNWFGPYIVTNVPDIIMGIYFHNETNGIAIQGKYIFNSTDGGYSWFNHSDSAVNDLNQIFFLNPTTGWIGGNGFVLKTTNSGFNWQTISYLPNEVRDINFLNENTGFLCGINNLFAKSTDGGCNWKIANLQIDNNLLYGVNFTNENTGWIYGYNGLILKTTDGGGVFISKTENKIPVNFNLYQNYPNPFNPSTKIKFEIPVSVKMKDNFVTLKVYDILGKEITTLVNEQLNAGVYEISFDGSNLSSGIYFYQIRAGDFSETRKMLMVK